MENLVAIMLLVGCSADGATCTEIPVPTLSYASIADCESELGLEMRLSATSDSRVLGACRAVDAALLEESASVEWAVSRGGELLVEIRPMDPAVVASNEAAPTDDLQRVAAR